MLTCPNCGGNLRFDIPSQQLACKQCQSQFDPYAFDEKTSDAKEETASDDSFEATIFTCPQCGGEILSTDNAATGFCSFCGASTILYSRLTREKRPDYIIPFKKTKEECKQAYAARMKKAWFAPKELKDPAYIDSFRGIYMPYWAFYITQKGDLSLPGKKSYRKGDYIYTDHYSLTGNLNAYYKGLSYDASSSFADNISEALAPYDVKGMKAFTPAYLSGFYADTADVDYKIYQNDAEASAVHETVDTIKKTKPFSSYTLGNISNNMLNTHTETVDRTMFPVWFLSYRKNDRVAYATVNGQTGKVVADIPVDTRKYVLSTLLLAVPIFLILALCVTLLPSWLLLACAILSVISAVTCGIEHSSIRRKDENLDDRVKQYQELHGGQNRIPVKIPKPKAPVGTVLSLIATALSMLIWFLHPVSDLWYYITAVFTLVIILVTFIDIIKAYNQLSTRRLPQFDRQGGDDRA